MGNLGLLASWNKSKEEIADEYKEKAAKFDELQKLYIEINRKYNSDLYECEKSKERQLEEAASKCIEQKNKLMENAKDLQMKQLNLMHRKIQILEEQLDKRQDLKNTNTRFVPPMEGGWKKKRKPGTRKRYLTKKKYEN